MVAVERHIEGQLASVVSTPGGTVSGSSTASMTAAMTKGESSPQSQHLKMETADPLQAPSTQLINAPVALDTTHSFTQCSAPFITCHSSSVFLTST